MKPTRIIVFRFSAFGDVLLTIPVIVSFLRQYPEVQMIFFTRKKFKPYFPEISNLGVIGIDLDSSFKGIFGMIKLYRRVKKEVKQGDIVLDLHSVIRTRFISTLLSLIGNPVNTIKKPRRLRKQYIKGRRDLAIPSIISVYKDVFHSAGFEFTIDPPSYYPLYRQVGLRSSNSTKKIGIAPFSKHATKTWPYEKLEETVKLITQSVKARFYVFCSQQEMEHVSELTKIKFENSESPQKIQDELSLLATMDVMVTMDSANMHLADIMGIPVVSIWGGTHPSIGFSPHFQDPDNIVSEPNHLECRPCSVYGKKDCKLKATPYACLTAITPSMVATKVLGILQ